MQGGRVSYAAQLRHLLIDLPRGTSPAQLAALRPDLAAAERACTDGSLLGVIVCLTTGARRRCKASRMQVNGGTSQSLRPTLMRAAPTRFSPVRAMPSVATYLAHDLSSLTRKRT